MVYVISFDVDMQSVMSFSFFAGHAKTLNPQMRSNGPKIDDIESTVNQNCFYHLQNSSKYLKKEKNKSVQILLMCKQNKNRRIFYS